MNLSAEYFKRSLKVAPGGVHSPVRAFKGVGGEPIFFKAARGAYLTSVDGEEYIDFCQSFGPNILGHRDPEVEAAVIEMIQTVWTLGTPEPYSLELAEWIQSRVPWVEKIRFVCSGTEAVMSALRVARAATGRDKILKFDGCYHGHTDSMLVKAGSGLADGTAASDSAGVPESFASQTIVASLDNEQAVAEIIEKQGDEIAAIILEPLPANFGLLIQREEFWRSIFAKAKAKGILLIFDEVISGFRVATGGMAEKLGVKPDLVTYGKIIGGGFPVGAYAGRSDLLERVAPQGPVYQAGTLAANPIGMRAGLVTLQRFADLKGHEVLAQRTTKFCNQLRASLKEFSAPLDVINYESLFWVHTKSDKPIRSTADFAPGHTENFYKLYHQLLKRKIFLAPSAFEVGFVSLAHSDDILQQCAGEFHAAIQEIYG